MIENVVDGSPITLAEVEKAHILQAMYLDPKSKPLVARNLGISLKTLYNKLNQYELEAAGRVG